MKFIDSIFAGLTCIICSFLVMSQENSFQDMLERFDCNCNMMLEKHELPKKIWHKVGSRDWDKNGLVDRKEYEGIIGWFGRE
jgi:hypothetical protein